MFTCSADLERWIDQRILNAGCHSGNPGARVVGLRAVTDCGSGIFGTGNFAAERAIRPNGNTFGKIPSAADWPPNSTYGRIREKCTPSHGVIVKKQPASGKKRTPPHIATMAHPRRAGFHSFASPQPRGAKRVPTEHSCRECLGIGAPAGFSTQERARRVS